MNNKSNKNLALALFTLLLSMLLLSFASAPIYNIFCKATGFGGTTMQGVSNIYGAKGTRQLTIEFDANVDLALPWRFIPKQRSVQIVPGQNTIIFYESENLANNDIIGTSVYNVTPNKVGKYFVKIHCFCFEEQLLKANEVMMMPVSFFIDQEFEKDPDMDDVHTITLSYSFFKVRDLPPSQ